MRRLKLLILICLVSSAQNLYAQNTENVARIPSQYFVSVSKKAESLEQKLDKKSEKCMSSKQFGLLIRDSFVITS